MWASVLGWLVPGWWPVAGSAGVGACVVGGGGVGGLVALGGLVRCAGRGAAGQMSWGRLRMCCSAVVKVFCQGQLSVWVPETRPWSLTCRDADRC